MNVRNFRTNSTKIQFNRHSFVWSFQTWNKIRLKRIIYILKSKWKLMQKYFRDILNF